MTELTDEAAKRLAFQLRMSRDYEIRKSMRDQLSEEKRAKQQTAIDDIYQGKLKYQKGSDTLYVPGNKPVPLGSSQKAKAFCELVFVEIGSVKRRRSITYREIRDNPKYFRFLESYEFNVDDPKVLHSQLNRAKNYINEKLDTHDLFSRVYGCIKINPKYL